MNTATSEHYHVGHYINGQRVEPAGARTQAIYNPAQGRAVGTLHLAGESDINAVVAAARAAAPAWADSPLTHRTRILFKMHELMSARVDAIAHAITREHGKTVDDAKGEIGRGLETLQFACGIIDQLKGGYSSQVATGIDVYSLRQPLGVVAGITPFNFPMMVPMWMIPVALATGNTFILKPSERDPSASLMLAELWHEAGLPDGVFNVLQGDKEAVDGLLMHPDVNGISFVGSTPIARYVYQTATAHGKRVQALGGAKNHVVVMPDADMDLAAQHVASSAFGSAGERCMAISVAVTVGDAGEKLKAKLADQAMQVVVAEGTNPKASMGPLITQQAKERVERIIGEAEADGAEIVVDGRGIDVAGHGEGFFVGPTVIDKISTEMSAYTEEIFGPVVVLTNVPTLDDAIALINRNPYGNGTGIFTNSGIAAREFERRIEVGMVGINIPVPVPVAWYSFGGWADSLFGDYHVYGADGVRFYTRKKVVTRRWPDTDEVVHASYAFPSH